MSEEEFHVFALQKWREREMTFPERTRRLKPDAWDYAAGAWARFIKELHVSAPKPR